MSTCLSRFLAPICLLVCFAAAGCDNAGSSKAPDLTPATGGNAPAPGTAMTGKAPASPAGAAPAGAAAGSATPTPAASPAPAPPAVPVPATAQTIPADGEYTGVKVEGQAVARIRIEKGGSVVWVDADGFQPVSWEQQFIRQGAVPAGYLTIRKVDTNGDGDLKDELEMKAGMWRMDEKGNITKS